MEYNTHIPSGYILFFRKDSIPEGWTICDGRDGTPDLSDEPTVWQSGHGPEIPYPDYVWCIKDWEKFKQANPDLFRHLRKNSL